MRAAFSRQFWLYTGMGISVLAASVAFAQAAEARQAAPITYAAQASPQSPNDLTGGADTSYGYGRNARANGPVIDLRRGVPSAQPQRQQVADPAPAQTAGQGTPDWLEHERVGPPYQANGRWYVPTPEPGYSQTGTASWYGPGFHGQASASGETYDQNAMTAAMPTLPIPSLVQVTNLANGREVILRVSDRGPFVGDRIIDVSRRAAEVLGFDQTGTARVHVRYLGPAPRHYAENGQAAPMQVAAAPMAPLTIAAGAPVSYARSAPQVARVDGPIPLFPQPGGTTETASAAPSLSETRAPTTQPPVQTVAWTQSQPQPLSATAAAPLNSYVVQVGAFSDPATAHRIEAAVQSAGSVSVDSRATASGATLYRVRLGPYSSREEADAARRAVANLGFAEAIVAH